MNYKKVLRNGLINAKIRLTSVNQQVNIFIFGKTLNYFELI